MASHVPREGAWHAAAAAAAAAAVDAAGGTAPTIPTNRALSPTSSAKRGSPARCLNHRGGRRGDPPTSPSRPLYYVQSCLFAKISVRTYSQPIIYI